MKNDTCSIDGCERPSGTRGWCGMHYARFIRHGDPLHSVYKNPDAPRPCSECGETDRPKAGSSRYCRDCWNALRRQRRAAAYAACPDPCAECGQAIERRWGRTRYCSPRCGEIAARRQAGYDTDPQESECARAGCAQRFLQTRRYQRFCTTACGEKDLYARQSVDPRWREMHARSGRAWMQAHPEYHAIRNGRRRARLRSATVHDISHEQLSSRFIGAGGRCWICKGAPDTWDHVKPLAKGGPHMLANLRPACRSCNSSKGAKWEGPQPT